MSDDHEEGEEEGGPTAAFSLVRFENPVIVQLEVRLRNLISVDSQYNFQIFTNFPIKNSEFYTRDSTKEEEKLYILVVFLARLARRSMSI